MKPNLPMLIVGTIIFLSSLGGWLYASTHDIDASAILAFASPVVGFLLLGNIVQRAATAAEQAASQTNGSLEAKIKANVSAALSERDQAKTWAVTNLGNKSDTTPTVTVTETLPDVVTDSTLPPVA